MTVKALYLLGRRLLRPGRRRHRRCRCLFRPLMLFLNLIKNPMRDLVLFINRWLLLQLDASVCVGITIRTNIPRMFWWIMRWAGRRKRRRALQRQRVVVRILMLVLVPVPMLLVESSGIVLIAAGTTAGMMLVLMMVLGMAHNDRRMLVLTVLVVEMFWMVSVLSNSFSMGRKVPVVPLLWKLLAASVK